MRKIIFHFETGSCGSEGTEAASFPDNVTEEELNIEAWERAIQHAESYGIYPESDLAFYSDEELAEIDDNDYSSGIEGWWEDYNPEKHDGLVPGGGEWQW
jgi:hypothetical protein